MKRKFMFVAMMAAMCSTALFTSCTEEGEEAEVAEEFKFGGLTAIANADGTIDISGQIATNTKIKEFALLNADGTVAYDFLEQNEQVKEKNKTLDDNGKAVKDKSFVLDVKSTGKLPVAKYTLVIKTKKNTEKTEAIGDDYSFEVGTGSNPTLGSQISLVDQKCYMLSDFADKDNGYIINKEDVAKTIEIVLKGDTETDPTPAYIESAKKMNIATNPGNKRTQEQADANKAILADAHVYDAAIITTTNCIATYKLTKVEGKAYTYLLSGIVINSKGTLKIDTSAAF